MNGNYTKHIYIGSQRIVSKLGDLDSYGSDPRRIEYAGSNVDGAKVDYKGKHTALQQTIKDRYATFEVPYNGVDNDDYVNGQGFCCDNTPNLKSFNPSQNDNPELFQYYYHSDHLGSSSLITNLDGDIVQHIEYVPFGEVFIEERNNTWNTPYLFNAKELDEETGLYYYGARYYDPRTSIWLSTDPLQERYPNKTPYHYCSNNPVNLFDPNGMDDYRFDKKKGTFHLEKKTKDDFDVVKGYHFNKDNKKWEENTKILSTKIHIDNVEKGILKDGMDVKTKDSFFEVSDSDPKLPSQKGIEVFALNLSELVGKEIGGSYFSYDGAADITHMTIGKYENNDRTTTKAHGVNLSPHFTGESRKDILKYKIRAGFHTHPSVGVSVSDRTTPSGKDLESRNNAKKFDPNFRSYILTQPLQYGGDFPHKIDYTNW